MGQAEEEGGEAHREGGMMTEYINGVEVKIICEGCKWADITKAKSWLSGIRTEVTCLKRFERNFWGNEVHLFRYDDFEHPFSIRECKFREGE